MAEREFELLVAQLLGKTLDEPERSIGALEELRLKAFRGGDSSAEDIVVAVLPFAYRNAGDLDSAIRWGEEVARRRPSTTAFTTLGDLEEARGRTRTAFGWYRKALASLSPDEPPDIVELLNRKVGELDSE